MLNTLGIIVMAPDTQQNAAVLKAIKVRVLGVGSRWLGKRDLDEDRPLGRGMRLKQEPAHIQDSSFASGTALVLSIALLPRYLLHQHVSLGNFSISFIGMLHFS